VYRGLISLVQEKSGTMGLFRRKVPLHYIPVHRDNITKRDWIILLEAGTIVGPSAEKLRVALATLEKKIVTKYNIFLRPEHFLVVEGYDPRIHALYYCPQLYKYDAEKKLVPLEGEEIGKLVAKAVVAQGRLKLRRAFFATSSNGASEPAMTIIGC